MILPRRSKARPREARTSTARGAATRARIVEAAAALVHLRGAGATSLEDIMEASATSKSQLYHYFDDKDALMRAVIEFQTRRVTAARPRRPKRSIPSTSCGDGATESWP